MEGTVASTGYDAINAVLAELVSCLAAPFHLHELRRSTGFENRAASIQNVGCANAIENFEVACNHSGVAPDDADHFQTALVGHTLDRSNVGIHAWGIAPTGKHCYAFHAQRK